MIADKPFGFTFLDILGATDAQVSYFEWLGGSPDGRGPVFLMVCYGDRPWWGTSKEVLLYTRQ